MAKSNANDHVAIKPGDWVAVEGMRGAVARVASLDARRARARVQMGEHEWDVPLARLRPARAPEKTRSSGHAAAPSDEGVVRVRGSGPIYDAVDLHGQRVEEALALAERGLDQAIVNGLDRFKIVHGHGTGSVRRAIRKMLDAHPHVESYRFGAPAEGGLACTVVFFRQGT
jgi:dsDNA-specific endonuclease/ATPase MutS2